MGMFPDLRNGRPSEMTFPGVAEFFVELITYAPAILTKQTLNGVCVSAKNAKTIGQKLM